uniref:Uncharacterized protein n=1 Tax=Mycena chlorophos TaxID=658473 RepID=A0ABQ0LV42_MYCCL|nr:predicted protein [Mycena chlorophos]
MLNDEERVLSDWDKSDTESDAGKAAASRSRSGSSGYASQVARQNGEEEVTSALVLWPWSNTAKCPTRTHGDSLEDEEQSRVVESSPTLSASKTSDAPAETCVCSQLNGVLPDPAGSKHVPVSTSTTLGGTAAALDADEREELIALRAIVAEKMAKSKPFVGVVGGVDSKEDSVNVPMHADDDAGNEDNEAPVGKKRRTKGKRKRSNEKTSVEDRERFARGLQEPSVLTDVSRSTLPICKLPAKCAVGPALKVHLPTEYQEQFLALPPLVVGAFRPWHPETPQYWMYSDVLKTTSKLHLNVFLTAAFFTMRGHYFNPSRASPADVIAVTSVPRATSSSQARWTIFVGDNIGIACTVIKVTASNLEAEHARENAAGGSLAQKALHGLVLRGEFERLVSFSCMALHQERLSIQMRANVISFQTLAQGWTTGGSPAKRAAGVDPFLDLPTPLTSSATTNAIPDTLAFDDDVMLYDCRNLPKTTTFSACLDLMENGKLPSFDGGEFAVGSVVIVGSTMNQTWMRAKGPSAGGPRVNFNIHWAMLIANPKK